MSETEARGSAENDAPLTPWFMCSECSEYAPVTDLRVEDTDWLSGEALTYVHRDHGEECDAWDDIPTRVTPPVVPAASRPADADTREGS